MSNKALVVLSGGMDSATALYWARSMYDSVEAVTIHYGQRHAKEIEYAEELTKFTSVPWHLIPISYLGRSLSGSALTDKSIEVPEGHYEEESMKATVVPNRNMILLSTACGVAVARGASKVIVGVHSGDHAIYPDCRPEFIDAFNAAVVLATQGFAEPDFEVIAPFIRMTKANICSEGESLGVPWRGTWSCYKGEKVHCGKCGTCTERREAFSLAGVVDPTLYKLDIK